MFNICVIPGTFDPVTNGHVDLIERAARLFDKIYVTAFGNSAKKTMFGIEDRKKMLELACEGIYGREKIIVDATTELLASYAKNRNAGFIVKGTRNSIDYEYEYMLYLINKEIGGGLETLFFPSKESHLYLSSTFVREMLAYDRDISDFVPANVCEYIGEILKKIAGEK
ncbi:MAG: pantetheine-phosphate adenylyltransferase [Oscillospiraceae bacterium]|nr:pantetheine-phosphate adenylyltransferase [Oscillospiraceae bacterium]